MMPSRSVQVRIGKSSDQLASPVDAFVALHLSHVKLLQTSPLINHAIIFKIKPLRLHPQH